MTFKFLNQTNFDALLSLYDRVNTNSLKLREDNLITSIFLQIYGQLEDDLYRECEAHFIKKNASIIRFEPALKAQGYGIDNDAWQKLIQIAKIRNCLIHSCYARSILSCHIFKLLPSNLVRSKNQFVLNSKVI
ncbi:hypothetical protein [Legionella sp. km772]|uniref:hypothetical protein n=1 Tax=Legionella sp. km772 TaxID=2498111 RepID=UPI000F8CA13E|nr:hypothetical protein [Legionella sp. km772]RUR04270.1 hypothetical protein ELY15_15725 [Legionella sp. km772]